MSGRGEGVATCTGEQTDRGPARLRQQTENGSSGSSRGAAGSWRLAGHLHGGAGGLAGGTRETADLEHEHQERARRAGGGPPAPGSGLTRDPHSGNSRLSP